MKSKSVIMLFAACAVMLSGCTQSNAGAAASAAAASAAGEAVTTASTASAEAATSAATAASDTSAETTAAETTAAEAGSTTPATAPVPDLTQQKRLFKGYIETQGESASLLAAPDDSADTVAADLTAGTVMEIYSCDADGWYIAAIDNGYIGYIRQEKVKEMPHKLPFGDPLFGGHITAGRDINLYSEADENSEVIRVLSDGTQIDVYESDYDGWYMTALPKEDGSGDFDYCFFKADLVSPIPDYDMDSGSANEYGFYPFTDAPASGVSAAALAGSWYCGEDPSALLIIREGSDIYNGTFIYADGSDTAEGVTKLEYALEPDGSKTFWYTFYRNDGTLWNAFSVSGELPLKDLYAGQSGEPHFIRVKEPEISDIAGVWTEADVSESRRLTINDDSTYKLESGGNTVSSGTIKIEYEEYSDGSTAPWFIFYDENGSLWEGFPPSRVQPQNDLCAGHTGLPHFVRES